MSYNTYRPHRDGTTNDRLLTPAEVAALFRVDPKTVTRWAAAGRIDSIRTPGGHRRFRESEIRARLEGQPSLPNQMRNDPHPVPLPPDEMGGDNRTAFEPPAAGTPDSPRLDHIPHPSVSVGEPGVPGSWRPLGDAPTTLSDQLANTPPRHTADITIPSPGITATQMANLTHPSYGQPCTPCNGPCRKPTPNHTAAFPTVEDPTPDEDFDTTYPTHGETRR